MKLSMYCGKLRKCVLAVEVVSRVVNLSLEIHVATGYLGGNRHCYILYNKLYTVSTQQHQYSNIMYAIGYTMAT